MGIYTTISAGSNLSQLVTNIELQHESIRSNERGTTTPTVLVTGLVWHRTDYPTIGDAWVLYNGSAFQLLLDPMFSQINSGGTVAFGANQTMGGFLLTGLGAGSASGHSVRYEQVVHRSGALAFTGDQSMGNFKLTNLAAPTSDNDAARKKYVDDAITAVAGTDAGTVTASNTQQTVTTGWQPSAVMIDLSGITYEGGTAYGAAQLFTAGTGVQTVACVARINGGTSSSNLFINIEVEFISTGFKVRIPTGLPWGNLRYVAVK